MKRNPYLALSVATMAIAWVQLGRNSKLTRGEKASAVAASVIVLLFISLVGEASPQIATGFATLLFISVLLGGTDAVSFLFKDLPHNLLSFGGGA